MGGFPDGSMVAAEGAVMSKAALAFRASQHLLPAAGVFVSGSILLQGLLHRGPFCAWGSSCAQVATDPRHRLLGLPIAGYGFAAFLLVWSVWYCGCLIPASWSRAAVASTALGTLGTLVSLWLLGRLVFVEHGYCHGALPPARSSHLSSR